jgi:hypothetical protein
MYSLSRFARTGLISVPRDELFGQLVTTFEFQRTGVRKQHAMHYWMNGAFVSEKIIFRAL